MGSGLILGIESSCDETAAAVVRHGRDVLSTVVSSQVAMHALYGGVVPELASREHLRNVVPVVRQAVQNRKPVVQSTLRGDVLCEGVTYNAEPARPLRRSAQNPFFSSPAGLRSDSGLPEAKLYGFRFQAP